MVSFFILCLFWVFGVFSVACFELSLVSTSASDCLERLVSEMTRYVSSGYNRYATKPPVMMCAEHILFLILLLYNWSIGSVEQEQERDTRAYDEDDGTPELTEIPEVQELREKLDQLNVELIDLRHTVCTNFDLHRRRSVQSWRRRNEGPKREGVGFLGIGLAAPFSPTSEAERVEKVKERGEAQAAVDFGAIMNLAERVWTLSLLHSCGWIAE